MAIKSTFSNGKTMTAGFYNGVRLTNRQAQFVEMLRNGLTTVDCADSFGLTQGTVASNLRRAMRVNGIATMKEFRQRLDLPPAGCRKAAEHFRVKDAVKDAVKVAVKEATQKPVPEWLLKRRAAEKARDAVEAAYDRAGGKAPATIPSVRPCNLTRDQLKLQLALRFNGDIHIMAGCIGWKVNDCLEHIMDACQKNGVQPTLDNFLSIK